MPVCRLLRVHSTGPAGSIAAKRGEQLLEHHPHLQPGQAGAQAEVQPVTEAEVRVRVAGDVERHRRRRRRSSSRFAEPSQTTTLSPGAMVCPPSSTVAVAVRRFDGDGVVQRSISSIAVPSSVGSSAQRGQLVGMLHQREHTARDRVAGGLAAGREQQARRTCTARGR